MQAGRGSWPTPKDGVDAMMLPDNSQGRDGLATLANRLRSGSSFPTFAGLARGGSYRTLSAKDRDALAREIHDACLTTLERRAVTASVAVRGYEGTIEELIRAGGGR